MQFYFYPFEYRSYVVSVILKEIVFICVLVTFLTLRIYSISEVVLLLLVFDSYSEIAIFARPYILDMNREG